MKCVAVAILAAKQGGVVHLGGDAVAGRGGLRVAASERDRGAQQLEGRGLRLMQQAPRAETARRRAAASAVQLHRCSLAHSNRRPIVFFFFFLVVGGQAWAERAGIHMGSCAPRISNPSPMERAAV